ncbi:uncharacterized protein J5F26_005060 isoform 1-T1 [Ciconia maguari]
MPNFQADWEQQSQDTARKAAVQSECVFILMLSNLPVVWRTLQSFGVLSSVSFSWSGQVRVKKELTEYKMRIRMTMTISTNSFSSFNVWVVLTRKL